MNERMNEASLRPRQTSLSSWVPPHSPLCRPGKVSLGCFLSHLVPRSHHPAGLTDHCITNACSRSHLLCGPMEGRGLPCSCSFSSSQRRGWHRGNAQEMCSMKKILEVLLSNPGAILAMGSQRGNRPDLAFKQHAVWRQTTSRAQAVAGAVMEGATAASGAGGGRGPHCEWMASQKGLVKPA